MSTEENRVIKKPKNSPRVFIKYKDYYFHYVSCCGKFFFPKFNYYCNNKEKAVVYIKQKNLFPELDFDQRLFKANIIAAIESQENYIPDLSVDKDDFHNTFIGRIMRGEVSNETVKNFLSQQTVTEIESNKALTTEQLKEKVIEFLQKSNSVLYDKELLGMTHVSFFDYNNYIPSKLNIWETTMFLSTSEPNAKYVPFTNHIYQDAFVSILSKLFSDSGMILPFSHDGRQLDLWKNQQTKAIDSHRRPFKSNYIIENFIKPMIEIDYLMSDVIKQVLENLIIDIENFLIISSLMEIDVITVYQYTNLKSLVDDLNKKIETCYFYEQEISTLTDLIYRQLKEQTYRSMKLFLEKKPFELKLNPLIKKAINKNRDEEKEKQLQTFYDYIDSALRLIFILQQTAQRVKFEYYRDVVLPTLKL